MIGKKGMIGEQVNWVYVLIAGSLILIFFVGLTLQQKKAAEKNYAEEAIKALDTLTLQPPKSSQLVEIPGLELRIECDSGKTTLRVGEAQPLSPYEPIFGPRLIKSNEIITMTDEWNVPFKATNFIFLTANDTRYIIQYDGSNAFSRRIAEDLYGELPEQANKKVVEKNSVIENENNRRTVFIGANTDPIIPRWAGTSAKSIRIDPQKTNGEINYEEGTIKFAGSTDAVDYTGKPMMIGAIYAENKESYDCTMKKAYKRLSIVSYIYQTKEEKLEGSFPIGSSPCSGKYNPQNIKDLRIQADNAIPSITAIRGLKSKIEQQNRVALLASCPSIY